MKIGIIGKGPLAEQAGRLILAAGHEIAPEGADFVLPATENADELRALPENALFDRAAWELCSSRLKTDELLRQRGIPAPEYFPGGSEPYLVKPDRGSFGQGIWVTDDYCEVGGAVNAGFVAQEEIAGDVWSVAVTGAPGSYTVHAPAKLTFDDRRRRTDAVIEPAPEADALAETARACAEAVGVRGVLEAEAMNAHGVWKVVDLNARLPMLTSDALLAQGDNLLEALIDIF